VLLDVPPLAPLVSPLGQPSVDLFPSTFPTHHPDTLLTRVCAGQTVRPRQDSNLRPTD
jgi:hypothetical protein